MISVHDTLTRSVVPLRPRADVLTMYSCGPTVYRYMHVGNLRTFMMADLLCRIIRYTGTPVRQIQNITDVGHMTDEVFGEGGQDRMEIAVEHEGKTADEIAAYYTEAFLRDTAAFNIERAAEYPRASAFIPQMQEIIAKLIERKHAYEVDGTVYYDVLSFPAYGALSGNTLDQLVADHRKQIGDGNKRHHADFVLWKRAGPNRTIKFPSPWGEGYPGWHVECSAMSLTLLGEQFDVHTGGEDNVFPHHEDEIAQSEGVVGEQVVSYWVHGAHLLSEGRKMSKSVGNVYTLRDLAEKGHTEPLAARSLFLQSRYRAQMNFTLDALSGAERTLQRWRRSIAAWAQAEQVRDHPDLESRFVAAVSDDMDTPTAMALVAEVVSSQDIAPGDKPALLLRWDGVLGLDLGRDVGKVIHVPEMVGDLLAQREKARTKKDWATADRLRHKVLSLGFDIEDTAAGPVARPRSH